jgi:Zn finger protein HypA/HybF involved in hydrogenase expression
MARHKRVRCDCFFCKHVFRRVPKEGIKCPKCGSYDVTMECTCTVMYIKGRLHQVIVKELA